MVTAKVLGPENLGIVATAGMVLSYGVLIQGGILDGLGLKIPLLIGEKKEKEALKYLNAGYTSVIFLVIISTIIFVALAPLFIHDRVILIGAIANAGALLAYEIYQIKEGRARLFFRFQTVFYSKLIYTFSRLIFVVVFCIYWGVYGMFAATILVYLPSYIYLRYKKENLGWVFNFNLSFELVQLGFPLLLAGAIFTLFQTIDRWFIIINYGAGSLGYYSIIATLAGMVLMVPIKFVSLLTQYLREQKGKGISDTALWEYVSVFMVVGIILFVPIIAGACNAAYGLFKFYLTQYDKTIPLVRILLLSCLIMSIFHVASAFLVVTDRKRYLLIAQFIAILFAAGFNWLAVEMGMSLRGIALATLASNIVLVAFIFYFIQRSGVTVAQMKVNQVVFIVAIYLVYYMVQNRILPLDFTMLNQKYLINLSFRFCMDICLLLLAVTVIKLTNMYKPLLEFMKR